MAKTDDEALAVRERNATRNDMLIEAAAFAGGIDVEQAQPIVTGVMLALGQHWRDEAAAIEAAKRRGWKSLADQVSTCAQHAAGIAESLKRHTGRQAPRELPPAVEIARDLRAGSVAELDARLESAVGPALVPALDRHIRVPRDLDDPTPAVRLCGAAGGTMTYPHEANCPQCLALQAGVEPLPSETPAELSAAVDAMREAEHVGAVAASESRDVITVPIPAAAPMVFVEPDGPPRRLTFVEVVEHGQARARGGDHRSVSQVQGYAECGVAYALSDLERPAWWLVGGTAFHAAAEEINRRAAQGKSMPSDDSPGASWMRHFTGAIAAQIQERPDVPMARWRTAAKGAEGYDWWRVEGEAMVLRYADWLRGMLAGGWEILAIDGAPVIEYETALDVDGVKVVVIIDLALSHRDGRVLIVDYKAGKSAPSDTFQLGVYAYALYAAVEPFGRSFSSDPGVCGQYYAARKGELVGGTDRSLVRTHSWEEIAYRVHQTDRAEKAGIYIPNTSRGFGGCGSCGVAEHCPVGAR